jgi:hypothetical protein
MNRLVSCGNLLRGGLCPSKGKSMLEIDKWSKEEVYEVMRELLYSFNYMWFMMEEYVKNLPQGDLESEAFLKFSEQFGSYQARRLARVSNPPEEEMDKIIYFLKRSHWSVFEDIHVERVSESEIRMRTFRCTSQKAARKWGKEYYECGPAALKLREGFFSEINPKARVERIFTPPDAKPAGIPEKVSCEWRITIGAQ